MEKFSDRTNKRALADFWDAESGSLIIFTLFLLVAMLVCVGVGIDTARYESYRTQLQNTADRAALAAANLDETRDARAVAEDYWSRAGFPVGASNIVTDTGANFRQVDISAGIQINNMLLGLVGNETSNVIISSSAREQMNETEISLVLDYSMSMIGQQKYQRLQAAASAFVDDIYTRDINGGITVNFVPYAGSVNAGPNLFSLLGGTRQWPNHSCLEMEAADFDTTGLPKGTDQVPHFEKYYNPSDPNSVFGWCQPDANRVRPGMNDPTAIKDVIYASKMSGGTGTDIAMKWGLALLDPASRPVLQALPAGERPAAGRPRDWDLPSSRKVIVLMTDGGITGQNRPIKTGIEDEDADDLDNEDDIDDVDGIDWDAINGRWKIGNQQQNARGTPNEMIRQQKSDALRNFFDLCDLAKARNITVYTIAYNAGTDAQDQMRSCASTPAFYFNVDLLDISQAFSSIALAISDIRLTR